MVTKTMMGMTVQRIVAPAVNPHPTKTTISQGVVQARPVLVAVGMIETKKTTNRVIPASVVLGFPVAVAVMIDVMNLRVAHADHPG
ncbi:MAG: hypothetical protein BroJett018_43960 [Chloroflexota bacterium]|nr:hypothetical protein [Chloroflexota bacterium]GIK66602.1 MAG: hypothetical protein BroJett018_43960 [Chloroflexota bacterium]